MVLHPEACWGGLPTRIQKTKIYNLEIGEFASTPPFKKKHLAGVILQVTVGLERLAGFFSKNHLAGIFQKPIWREQFHVSNSSGNIFAKQFGRRFEIFFSL
jgi:hypothetical protein